MADLPRIDFEAVLDRLNTAVVVTDVDGRLLYANPYAEEVFGWMAESLMGSALPNLSGVEVSAATASDIGETLSAGRVWEGEFDLNRPDGTSMSVHVADTGLFDDAGELIAVVSVVSDVTETKRSVQRLISEAEALRFLLDATTILSRAVDFEDCVRQLAALAVPLLGDLCLIDVLEDQAVRRVAAVHADPSKTHLAERLSRYPPSTVGPHPAAETIRSGHPFLSNGMTDEFLRQNSIDAEHYALVTELGMTAFMCAPLLVRGRILGSVTVLSAGSGRVFDSNDLSLVGELAARAGQVVDNARLFSEQARVTRSLQAALLPPALPDIPGLALAAAYRTGGPHSEVGGDFYDVFEIGRGSWVLAVGDVSGRGPDAAAITGLVRHALRASAQHDRNPAAMLAVANRLLSEQASQSVSLSMERFCTAACAVVRPGDPTRMTVATAGHPPLIVVRADGTIDEFGAESGPALGITDDFVVRAQRLTLRRGDLLLLYTDGLTEAREAGGAFFGENELGRLLSSVAGWTPDAVVGRLINEVDAYSGGHLKDDLSLLVVAPAGG